MRDESRVSIYCLPGRAREPGQVVEQARDAEAAGFAGVWLSERLDLKELGVLVGAVAATTQRIRIASGLTHLGTRHPVTLAALAATAQAVSGGRFVLGLGRGMPGMAKRLGSAPVTSASLEAFPDVFHGLWRGDRVSDTKGMLGGFDRLRFVDVPPQQPPPLVLGTFGNRGFDVAAKSFDGVLIHPLLTTPAVAEMVENIRAAASREGREVRVYSTLLVAPDLPQATVDRIIGARAVTYLQARPLGDLIVRANGWDEQWLADWRGHPDLQGAGLADVSRTRAQLEAAGERIPRPWIEDATAIGSAADCAARIRGLLDAGVDEVVLHASVPSQSASILEHL